MPTTRESVTLSIVFKKGMADEHRLPLSSVIATLQHMERMIREIGKQIQHEAGVERPDGDFGIVLLAGARGVAFGKGSVTTTSAITRDVQNGIRAISKIIETTDVIEKKKPLSADEYGEQILRQLPKVSEIQERDKTELYLAISENKRVLRKTKFGERGREALRGMESAELALEAITVYGKLRELQDRGRDDEQSGFFWGELSEDNGRRWSIKFRDSELYRVLKLFRKQVIISGRATYFRTKLPRIDAVSIEEEKAPDYLAAFDRFRATYEDVFGEKEPMDILNKIRE